MSPTIQRRLWLRPLSVLFLLTWGASALRAEPPPLPRATQQRVNKSVDDGVRFLYASQGALGSWSADGKHVVGYTALPGLTLLECGESALEPAVRRAAEVVRQMAPKLDTTYEIALSILFLDKLGNGGDRPLIEMLAARLIAGQTTTGGWSYRCPLLSRQNQLDLLKLLRQLEDQPHFDPDLLVTGGSGPLTGIGSPGQPDLQVPGKDTPPKSSGSDSSAPPSSSSRSPGENVAVGPELKSGHVSLPRAGWCIKMGENIRDGGDSAPKAGGKGKPPVKVFIPPRLQGLPVLMDPAKVLKRVMDPADKGQQIRGTTDNSNTQFATLALWAARRHGVPMKRSLNLLVYRFRTSQNENGSWGYPYRKGGGLPEGAPMTCVGLLGLAVGHGVAHDRNRLDPQAAARRARDPQLVNGLAALSKHVGQPAGRLINLQQPNLYFLWSVERVGVLYNLPTIGGKEWYRWAAECLVANQQQLGHWTNGGYPGATPVIDTCLALLVLKKANLASDLTDQLKISPGDLAGSVEKKLAPPPPAPETVKPASPGSGKAKGGNGRDNPYKPDTSPAQPGLTAGTPSQPQQPTAPSATPPTASTTPSSALSTNDSGGREKGGGKKLWMILVCAAGILLLGLSIFLLLMNRKREQAPVEGTAPKKKKTAGGARKLRPGVKK